MPAPQVLEAVTDEFLSMNGANSTQVAQCPESQLRLAAEGCSQVRRALGCTHRAERAGGLFAGESSRRELLLARPAHWTVNAASCQEGCMHVHRLRQQCRWQRPLPGPAPPAATGLPHPTGLWLLRCLQVVAGTRYQLRVNISCGAETVGLQAEVFQPLPADNGGANQTMQVGPRRGWVRSLWMALHGAPLAPISKRQRLASLGRQMGRPAHRTAPWPTVGRLT